MRAYSQEDGGKSSCDRDAADFTNRSVGGPGQSWGYTCYPDTVDPRGVKGDGR